MNSSLWAITSYFNPVGFKRRLTNYRVFRKFLDAPLLTVEWSPTGEFQLQKDDADILIQLSGGDVMWQKERLLNVAVRNLPASCDIVAWLDCDIVFAHSDWPVLAREMLGKCVVVQLFKTVHYLPGSAASGHICKDMLDTVVPTLTAQSFASRLGGASRRVQEIERRFQGEVEGFAWAASREALLNHGFYDARIVGGGRHGNGKSCLWAV